MNTYVHLPIEAGQTWEGRIPRRDGTRERAKVLEVNGREALIESENPRPPRLARRTVGLLLAECPGGTTSIGNMRLVRLADGRRVVYPQGGGMQLEEP